MPANVPSRRHEPFPVRGHRCLDWWQVPDLIELAAIRAQVARFDAACAQIAAELQRDERRGRKQREIARESPAARGDALGLKMPNGAR